MSAFIIIVLVVTAMIKDMTSMRIITGVRDSITDSNNSRSKAWMEEGQWSGQSRFSPRIHRAQFVKDRFREQETSFSHMDRQPKSPDLNPTETLWDVLEKALPSGPTLSQSIQDLFVGGLFQAKQ